MSQKPNPAQSGALARQLVKVVLLTALLLSLLCALTLVAIGAYALGATRAEAEFYRGVYSICLAQTRNPQVCRAAVAELRQQAIHELELPGWAWPVEGPAPAPDKRLPGQIG